MPTSRPIIWNATVGGGAEHEGALIHLGGLSVVSLTYYIIKCSFAKFSFTLEERQLLGIHGLLPPRVMTMDEAVDHSLRNLGRYK